MPLVAYLCTRKSTATSGGIMGHLQRVTVVCVIGVFVFGGIASGGKKIPRRAGGSAGTLSSSLSPHSADASEIFQEGFNDTTRGSDTTIAGFPPPGWIMINADGNVPDSTANPEDTCWYQTNKTGFFRPLFPHEGAAFAVSDWVSANADGAIDDWLITPNTGSTVPAGSIDSLIFYVVSRSSSTGWYPDSLEVSVSTTNTDMGSFTTKLGYFDVPKTAWTRFAFQLPQAPTRYIAFRYLLYNGGSVGSSSDALCLDDVHIVRTMTTSVNEKGDESPLRFVLLQNFPNPFNPSTRIPFILQENGWASLEVFNLLGQKVATLFQGSLSAGEHYAEFNGTALPSGAYIYRLMSGRAVASRTMILSR